MSKEQEQKILESLKPQMMYFEVIGIPRTYINPRLGLIDLRLGFSDEKALECYKDKNFPYLQLKKGAEELFKNEKVDTILYLIGKTTITSDVEILSKSKPESKKVQQFSKERINHLNS
jgi:hypothetical protein